MHQTALLGQAIKDAPKFGWQFSEKGGILKVPLFSYVFCYFILGFYIGWDYIGAERATIKV